MQNELAYDRSWNFSEILWIEIFSRVRNAEQIFRPRRSLLIMLSMAVFSAGALLGSFLTMRGWKDTQMTTVHIKIP
jgi:hypothetical protein